VPDDVGDLVPKRLMADCKLLAMLRHDILLQHLQGAQPFLSSAEAFVAAGAGLRGSEKFVAVESFLCGSSASGSCSRILRIVPSLAFSFKLPLRLCEVTGRLLSGSHLETFAFSPADKAVHRRT
jgi:hypothetical protein